MSCLDDDLMLNFNVHIDSDRFQGAATSMRGVQPTSIKDDVNAASKIFIVFPHTLFLADSHFPADARSAPTMLEIIAKKRKLRHSVKKYSLHDGN